MSWPTRSPEQEMRDHEHLRALEAEIERLRDALELVAREAEARTGSRFRDLITASWVAETTRRALATRYVRGRR